MHGFTDELVKTARLGSVAKFLKRVERSPALRASIRRSGLLGAGTGAATGAIAGDEDKSFLRRIAKGALVGGLGGVITGGAFPGWFGKSNMKASDEMRRGLLARGRD